MTAATGRSATPEAADGVAPFDVRGYLADVGGVLSWRVLQVVAVTLLIALTEGLSLLLLAPLLELTGLDLGASPVNKVAAWVERAFATLGLPVTLASVISAYVLIVVLRALFNRWGAMSNFRLRQRFTARLRERLHGALIQADWLFFVNRRSSDFMHKLTRELETVAIATFGILEWAVTLLLTSVYLAYAVYLSPTITVVVLASGVTLNLLLRLEMRRAKPRGARLSSAYEEFYAAISDHFSGMKTAKSHGVESAYKAHFLRTARAVEQA
ncbi:MAG TPA: ABC transporter transmembrane domain-containing protein, partial [Trueperaceae bacterium]|nr:ABC transporter transmembrane domain-containing protein [Trueperaceae bacterium]